MTNTTLSSKTVVELKEMAKEAKVKNWWVLKKVELIQALEAQIELVPQEEEEEETVEHNSYEDTVMGHTEVIEEVEVEADTEIITLKELAFEYGFKETKARRILRNKGFQRTQGRWEWSNEETIQQIREAFDQYKK